MGENSDSAKGVPQATAPSLPSALQFGIFGFPFNYKGSTGLLQMFQILQRRIR